MIDFNITSLLHYFLLQHDKNDNRANSSALACQYSNNVSSFLLRSHKLLQSFDIIQFELFLDVTLSS